jgi:hypothetical protein
MFFPYPVLVSAESLISECLPNVLPTQRSDWSVRLNRFDAPAVLSAVQSKSVPMMSDIIDRYKEQPQTSTKRLFAEQSISLGAPLRGSSDTTLYHGAKGSVPLILKKLADDELQGYKAIAAVQAKDQTIGSGVLNNLVQFILFCADSPTPSPTPALPASPASLVPAVSPPFHGSSLPRTPTASSKATVTLTPGSPTMRHWASMAHYPRTLDGLGKPLGAKSANQLVSQMTVALNCLHEVNLAHMDVKPSNIFVDSSGAFLLGDFGSVREIGAVTFSTTWTFVPSDRRAQVPSYAATAQHDWWMLGMTVIDMLMETETEVGHGVPTQDPSSSYVLKKLAWLAAAADAGDSATITALLTILQADDSKTVRAPPLGPTSSTPVVPAADSSLSSSSADGVSLVSAIGMLKTPGARDS